MEYESLGACEKTRERRYKVYSLKLCGFTPKDISKDLKTPISTIYKDLRFIGALPITRNPDLEAAKEQARDYWLFRLKYYSKKECRENNPPVQIAWAKLKDSAFEQLSRIATDDLIDRISQIEKEVFNVPKY